MMPGKKMAPNSKLIFLIGGIGAFVFISCTFKIFTLMYNVQPIPIVDEVFHIPQAANYCKGLFKEYDKKITTLPGLYLISVGVLRPLSLIRGEDFCGVYALRFTNLVACILNFYLLFALQRKVKPYRKDVGIFCADLLSAVNMAIFPILYFFTFLYYTDTCSTTMVLLMYLLHLENCYATAASIAAVAFAVRQTNIIWLGLLGLLALEHFMKREVMQTRKRISSNMESSFRYLQVLVETTVNMLNRGHMFLLLHSLFFDIIYYGGICFLFVLFLYINGGSIVVGDKNAHVAVINLPQLLYFSMFTTFFSFPYFVRNIFPFIKCIFRYKRAFVICFVMLSCIVYVNTHVHPYLLADNRHYVFYVWRRIYEYHFSVKYILLPVSMFGMYSIYQTLRHTNIVFQLGYLLCVILSLVPLKFLEFRYFIIPFLLFRIHITSKQWWQLILEFVFFSCVNATTIFLFVTKEFYWHDSKEVQRIMW